MIRSTVFPLSKMRVKENSKVHAMSFKLADTVLIGYSDGSIIKAKYNEDPINLLYESKSKRIVTSDEEEFDNIQSVYSTDYEQKEDGGTGNNNINNSNSNNNETSDNSFSTESNPIEFLLVSNKYKIVFSIQKFNVGVNRVNLYCLRNNRFERPFCKLDGVVNCAKLIDKKDLLLVITFKFETKKSTLEIWHYNEASCALSTFNLSSMLDYPFTIRTMNITQMPNRYYGRNTNHGIVDGDMIFFGTTRGDVIMGKILPLMSNGKIGFDPLYIYKLKNDPQKGEEMANKYEISFVSFDLYFDVLMLGDVSSNVRCFEKILQIGKAAVVEENLPFFSFFYDNDHQHRKNADKKLSEDCNVYNSDLPVFSVSHDVIKDRSIIIYDQGRDLVISSLTEDTESEENKPRRNLGDLLLLDKN